MIATAITLGVTLLLLTSDQAAAAVRSTTPPSEGRLVLEGGYTVSTLLDGNKLGSLLHPYSILPFPEPSRRHDRLLLLDAASSAFYTLSLPVSQGSEVKKLSGNGAAGFSDGDMTTAMFRNPRSFAVDSMGNVYVADRGNFAIRKISASGITSTIAGGYSQNKTGHTDGPAQNATFSNDFDLVFVPEICTLLISDRGNRLIRQMSLKPDDCQSRSHSGLGTTSVSLVAFTCVLFGTALGFIAHSFYACRNDAGDCSSTKMQKHCQTHPVTLTVMFFSVIKSAVARSTPFMLLQKLVCLSLSYLFCIFRIPRKGQLTVIVKKPTSWLDSDASSDHGAKASNVFTGQLKDLISLDGDPSALDVESKPEDEVGDILPDSSKTNLDEMIRENILQFTSKAKQQDLMEQSSACGSSLLKRRPGVHGA